MADQMLDVCVVLMDDGYASTALMPIEVFHSAGALWRELKGQSPEPRFRRDHSLDQRPVGAQPLCRPHHAAAVRDQRREAGRCDHRADIRPVAGRQANREQRDPPWLRRHYAAGAYVAGVCMGAAYLAEAGLLDGRRATTHWAVADDLQRRWPKVAWHGDHILTEDQRVLCSGGVTAAADVSLYLVEKLCGHEVAVQTAKALLLSDAAHAPVRIRRAAAIAPAWR